MVSPRTRNLPRPSVMSLRSYCMSTSRREDVALVVLDADAQVEQLAAVLLGVAEAVDARHRRHDDDVTAREQR